MSKVSNLSGIRFGRLIAISRRAVPKKPSGTASLWLCICDCGKETEVALNSLRAGLTKSCGCLQKDITIQRSTKRQPQTQLRRERRGRRLHLRIHGRAEGGVMILHYRERDIPLLVAEIAVLKKTVAELRAERERMQAALKKIAKWQGEFPATGEVWEDNTPISYTQMYGTKGERDYMRAIAATALASPPAAEEPKL